MVNKANCLFGAIDDKRKKEMGNTEVLVRKKKLEHKEMQRKFLKA